MCFGRGVSDSLGLLRRQAEGVRWFQSASVPFDFRCSVKRPIQHGMTSHAAQNSFRLQGVGVAFDFSVLRECPAQCSGTAPVRVAPHIRLRSGKYHGPLGEQAVRPSGFVCDFMEIVFTGLIRLDRRKQHRYESAWQPSTPKCRDARSPRMPKGEVNCTAGKVSEELVCDAVQRQAKPSCMHGECTCIFFRRLPCNCQVRCMRLPQVFFPFARFFCG